MRLIPVIAILLALLLGGYLIFVTDNLQQEVNSLQEQLNDIAGELQKTHQPEEEGDVTLFFIRSTPTDFLLVPVSRHVLYAPTPTSALRELVKGPAEGEGDLESPIPPNTKLIGLSVHQGLAMANFSSELVDSFVGGAQLESHLLNSIVNTLTEFTEIERVQILVNGEAVESIGGHMESAQPLSRTTN